MMKKFLTGAVAASLALGAHATHPSSCTSKSTQMVTVSPTCVVTEVPVTVTGTFTSTIVTVAPSVTVTVTAPGTVSQVVTVTDTRTVTATCPTSGNGVPTGSSTSGPKLTTPVSGSTTGGHSTGGPSTGGPSTGCPSARCHSTGTGDPSTGGPSTGGPSTGGPSTGTGGPSTSGPSTNSSTTKTGTGSPPTTTKSTTGNSSATTPQSSSISTTTSQKNSTSSTTSPHTSTTLTTTSQSNSTSTTNQQSSSTSATTPQISSTSTTTSPSSSSTTTSPSSSSTTTSPSSSTSTTASQTSISTTTPQSSSTTSPPASTTTPTKTTSTSTTSTCVPTPTSSVCASALPQACTSLAQKNGTALAAAIPDCISSLGVAYTGDAVTCVFKGITDPGPKIVNCLGNVVLSHCLFALPRECLVLAGTTGQAVATQFQSCLQSLGPFAVRNSSNCLIKGVSTGDDVLNCLVTTLGLPGPNKVPGSCDPPPPSKACTTRDNLPQSCRKLAGLKGIASTFAAAQCAASLGPYTFDRFSSCFNIGNIANANGDNILSCVTDQLTGLCITTLPPSCSALIGLNPDLAREKVRQCLNDVGPFVTDATQKCYDTVPLPDGRKIYDCLNGVFFNGKVPPAKAMSAEYDPILAVVEHGVSTTW